MKTILLTLLALVLGLLLAVLAFVQLGLYPVGADQDHPAPLHWLLETVRVRAVARQAETIAVPTDLDAPERARRGAGNYDAMCVGCHLRPGLADSELQRGLNPPPPKLAEQPPQDPSVAFWTIRHGVISTGMPAWGRSMDDAHIWDLVALLQRLPTLDAADYRALVGASDGHSHGGGETLPADPAMPTTAPHDHPADGADEDPTHAHDAPAPPTKPVHRHRDGSEHEH